MRRSTIPRRQHEEILATARRHHEEQLAAVNADRERLRAERDQFAKDRDVTAQAAANDAAKFEARIARLKEQLAAGCQHVTEDTETLQRRIKRLEKQIDDATSIGDVGVPAGADWRRRPESGAR